MWSVVGAFPGFMPRSHDSVAQMMSGFVYCSIAANSCVLLSMLQQFSVRMRRFVFFGRFWYSVDVDLFWPWCWVLLAGWLGFLGGGCL